MPSRKPEDLHPLVYPLYRSARARWTKGLPPNVDVLLTCTYRSNAEQAALYAIGRTKPGRKVTWAPEGTSNHNFTLDGRPASLAFDIVPLRNGKPIWGTTGNGIDADPTDDDRDDLELWQRIAQHAKDAGLAWAGDWRPGKREFPHFEHPKAKDIRLNMYLPEEG
jgi:peptidoglycan LD-endopeptidase CwlK